MSDEEVAVPETNVSPAPITMHSIVVDQVRPVKPRTALDTTLSLWRLSNASLSILLLLVQLNLLHPSSNLEKLLSHVFRDTDDPTTIHGTPGKLRHMLFVTLMIQQPYMVDLGYYRKLSCHTKTCKVSCLFFIV